jgi:hypothetical protein
LKEAVEELESLPPNAIREPEVLDGQNESGAEVNLDRGHSRGKLNDADGVRERRRALTVSDEDVLESPRFQGGRNQQGVGGGGRGDLMNDSTPLP